jgi:hypothetical protein
VRLVAGVDSSTQSVKVTIRDADTGEEVRSGRAAHPDGTHVDPRVWWDALQSAIEAAGGSTTWRRWRWVPSSTAWWPSTPRGIRSSTRCCGTTPARPPDAEELVRERGAQWWAEQTGSLPVASFTVTKLAWLAREHPELAARVDQVMLPHDYLTWRLRGRRGHHGPGGCQRHRLLLADEQRVPAGSGRGDHGPSGPPAAGARAVAVARAMPVAWCSAPAPATTWPPARVSVRAWGRGGVHRDLRHGLRLQ